MARASRCALGFVLGVVAVLIASEGRQQALFGEDDSAPAVADCGEYQPTPGVRQYRCDGSTHFSTFMTREGGTSGPRNRHQCFAACTEDKNSGCCEWSTDEGRCAWTNGKAVEQPLAAGENGSWTAYNVCPMSHTELTMSSWGVPTENTAAAGIEYLQAVQMCLVRKLKKGCLDEAISCTIANRPWT